MDNLQNKIVWFDELSQWQEVDKDYLAMLKGSTSLEDRRDQYSCTWEIPPRRQELIKRLEQYYKDTPTTMSNAYSRPFADEFSKWCEDGGYSNEEVSQVRSNYMRHER